MNLGSRQLLICLNGDKKDHMETTYLYYHTQRSLEDARLLGSVSANGGNCWLWDVCGEGEFFHVYYILQAATIFHAGILQSLSYALVITNTHIKKKKPQTSVTNYLETRLVISWHHTPKFALTV